VSTTHHLQFPLSKDQVRSLRSGDLIYVSGEIVVTAGLPTHQRILEYLEQNKPLPIDLSGTALFHIGSYSHVKDGKFEVLYINPTTSTRFNPYMPKFIRSFGLCAVGGKGGLDAECTKTMKEVGCVYLSFLGGGCTLLSAAIRDVVTVAWEDLIPHYRLVKLRVEELGPATVGIDAHGDSLYDDILGDARAKLPQILAELDRTRGKVTT